MHPVFGPEKSKKSCEGCCWNNFSRPKMKFWNIKTGPLVRRIEKVSQPDTRTCAFPPHSSFFWFSIGHDAYVTSSARRGMRAGALDIGAVGRILLFICAHVTTVLRLVTIVYQNIGECDRLSRACCVSNKSSDIKFGEKQNICLIYTTTSKLPSFVFGCVIDSRLCDRLLWSRFLICWCIFA